MANLVFDFLHNYVTGERRASDPADAYQYDEGHVLEAVVPVAVTSCEIQYWIRGMEKADAYTPTSITQNTDNTYTILGNIPNSYFETNGDLRVYIVVTDGDASITTYEGYIHIKERQMPEDYVDDDPDNEAVRVIAEAQAAAATATQKAGEAAASAEQAQEILDSIPEDYSQLTEDVSNLKEDISNIEKTTDFVKPSSLSEMKQLLPFAVGDLRNGELGNYKKRISNSRNVVFDEDVVVETTNDYRCGYCVFDSMEAETTTVWVGWNNYLLIPKGTIFKLQLARPVDEGADITDPYNNDIYDNLRIFAIGNDNSDYNFKYSHNGLKVSEFKNYSLWSQGCARVRDTLVGFNASNDTHTNTSTYDSMYYADGYAYNARGNHNLGHCASADYRSDTDVMLVANGTYAEGVVPTVYLISNAYATTDSGNDILVTDSNVMALEFTTLDGTGCIACFGETSDIIYVMTADDPAHPFANGNRYIYIYKMLLGKGSADMTTLHPSDSVGTFVSGKSDMEFNGTAYIMNYYVAKYPIELQGMKYINGQIMLSIDTYVNNIVTGYLADIKLNEFDQSFIISDAKWIPSLDENGNYVMTEPEGFAVADGVGYITIFRNTMSANRSKTLEFYLNE